MTIPASFFVSAVPGVLSAGGNSLVMNGLFFTENTAMPTGTVLNFGSLAAVGSFFGLSSAEYAAAQIYFAGYANSTIKPGGMLFAAYNVTARAAFIQGGSLAGVALTTLQGYTGTLTVDFAGTPETSSTINLSAATSFSNAATLIQAGFTSPGFTVSWNPVASAFVITSTTTGATETIAFVSGSLAADLALTQATGAFLSQGAAADTAASALANAVAVSQNFASIVTLFEPSTPSAKQAWAVAVDALEDEYLYLAWDSDPNASVQGNQTCFGYLASQAEYSSVAAFSGDPALAASTGVSLATLAMNLAIFAAGAIASINFTQQNGRTTLAYLSSSQISPTCANLQTCKNLLANGYNFYGSVSTANQGFVFLYSGQMFGPFVSIVRYINQIYLNSQFQLALMTLVTSIGSIGYNAAYFDLIRNALTGSPNVPQSGPISQALNFGTIRTGVTLSAAQISELNQAAGVNAASVVQTSGYYLQILDPGAPARALGQSPIINFWYTDGGDVLQISLSSIDIL